ncbi:hypothetical protein [Dolichospermum circinale]|uniref:hypothetical protein n=1 Tax=Dolichospermum circinale TaxID=109265 RepID=UPI00041F37D9|nr:hypothetical protein [Dolichospermum circinale]MDB9476524.1 hypothetical protein [Dolichospermum circinale CS-537/11]MDB9480969.1 hypothetical protein [Dolichospermum circinale CS-537/03]MDB9484833.1 hypothetical protein [Dolichospermum circinale CS-537/05]
MVKLRQLIAGLMTATVLVSSTTPVDAQKRPVGVGSLGEMSCQGIEYGRYKATNKDFPIGLQIFRGIAIFSTNHRDWIGKQETNQVACRLTEAGQKAKYKTLNLAFGIADNNRHAQGSLVRLSIYRDGNFYQYKDVTKGQLLSWPIDVRNVRSIALEAECLRGSTINNNTCPPIIFFEDTLQ